MVGSAILARLKAEEDNELVTRSRSELDLRDQSAVRSFFSSQSIDEVYLAAAKVGGIQANNNFPADFIAENLAIQSNVISGAFSAGVKKLLFLGSSCIYPKFAKQPISEKSLLTGELEPTNEPYAVAKIAGIKLCESYCRQYGVDYRSVMPTNLYGEGDNFHPENSHVIPAMMRRFHLAKLNQDEKVVVWGSGKPMREFLHVADMADACVYIMNLDSENYQKTVNHVSHINIGTGVDCTIRELAESMARVIGFDGLLTFDQTKPDGTPRKLLDTSLLNELGWRSSIELEDGLARTYRWFVANAANLRGVR